MIIKPVKVPQAKIGSVDVPNCAAGLYMGGAQNAPINAFISSKDVELTRDGYLTHRRTLSKFLPDTVETTYQKFPVLWEGEVYYFTADDGKVKFCQEGDTDWTDCGGASNSITTNAGGKPKFLRVLNNVLLLNGTNGDKLAYVDLTTAGFPLVKFTAISDPASSLTDTLTGLSTTGGLYHTYYAYTYTTKAGETMLSPILDLNLNYARDDWSTLASPGSVKLTRPDFGSEPAGADKWTLYCAISSTQGSIQDSDFVQLAVGLDLATGSFVDDGTVPLNLGSTAPIVNSTDGPKVDHGLVEDGNPILWGDVDDPYNIWIGGGGIYAMDFSANNGGAVAPVEQGTNYYPVAIIGFRTGQGLPALTVLYSNTEGLSKQSTLQQSQINYGDQTFTVWGATEQHYGAAGVAAPNSAINYNGKLLFLSSDGFMSAETQATLQNVLSILPISGPIDKLVRTIKNSAMGSVVGTGWNNKYMWLVPSGGFDTPQEIAVLDTNNKGIEGHGAWYTMDIAAQWIGTVSPLTSAAFVYICQGNKTYKLLEGKSSYDTKNGVSTPFSMNATGAMIPMGGAAAHNHWQADVQTVFYIMGLIGDITVGIKYRNQNGRIKTKSKLYHGPVYTPSGAGGWGDTQYTYANFEQIPGWGSSSSIDDTSGAVASEDVRIPVQIDDVTNEAEWFFETPIGYSAFDALRAISFEGIDLGVRPDLQ